MCLDIVYFFQCTVGVEFNNSHRDTHKQMKLARHIYRIVLILILAPLIAGGALGAPSAWQDYSTGLAIGGYDPVAYYIQGKAANGHDGIEHRWGGANWRFANTGNRDAFAKHPSIYAPQFSGYDVVSLSKSLTVQGSPTLWVLFQRHVYLFANRKNLAEWQRNRGRILTAARANWSALGENLPGTSENK